MMKWKWITLVIVFIAFVVMAEQVANTPAPSKYQPTEVQSLRLKVAFDDARLAQRDAQDAQTRFQQSLSALTDAADKIKQENKWPATVQFNMDSLTFADAPPPPKPAEVKKP